MTDSQKLLADYAKNGSEPAFRELVARYIDLVYGSALRLVEGDSYLAEDVAQTVFVDLAQMAGNLSGDVRLGGWLHRHTCFVAAKTMRSERRRQSRERQAVAMNSLPDHSDTNLARLIPLLDNAVNWLGTRDRMAITLRFFEQRDLRSVGEALGCNEDAAQKRVSRALEKLRLFLKRRGLSLSVGALGAVIASEAATAAPTGLAVSISGVALAKASAGVATTFTLAKLFGIAKFKAAAAAVVLSGVVVPVWMQYQANAGLVDKLSTLHERFNEVARAQVKNQRLSNLVAKANEDHLSSSNDLKELLRLRSEVAQLREERQRLKKIQASILADQKAKVAAVSTNSNGAAFPKESWAFVGRTTPESALQSFFWAKSQGDLKMIRESYSTGTWNVIVEYTKEHSDEYRGEGDLGVINSNSVRNVTGFRIVRMEQLAEDEVSLEIVEEGGIYAQAAKEGKPRLSPMFMKRIGSEWKIGHDD